MENQTGIISKTAKGNNIEILVEKQEYIKQLNNKLDNLTYMISDNEAKNAVYQTEVDAIISELDSYK